MKTQYYTATSIDGYIADENNSLDWLFQIGQAESMKDHYPTFISRVGASVMGSTTYEWILDHENLVEKPEKWPYDIPTWVFTRRNLPVIEGAEIRFVRGGVAAVYEEMTAAANGKNIWLVGGGDLVGQFHDAGLLDEIILGVAPVTLGAGAPLLPRRITNPYMLLTHVEQLGDFAMLTYTVRR